MAPAKGRNKATPDSGEGRSTAPGPRGRKADLTTADESLQERDTDAGSIFDDPEGEVLDEIEAFADDDLDLEGDEDIPAIHETDLHSFHADHDADSADADEINSEWDDGILDLKALTAPRPNVGMVQRWVKIMHPDGSPATENWSKKSRLGWSPRAASSVPEKDRLLLTERHAKLGDVLMVQGLVLCEMTQRQADKIARAVKARANKLKQAAAAPVRTASRAGMRAGYGAGIVVDQDTSTTRHATPRGRRG